MKTIEVKTSELEGVALDYAVAISEGFEWTDDPCEVIDAVDRKRPPVVTRSCLELGVVVSSVKGIYRPSTEWSQGGPLIEKYSVGFTLNGKDWLASEGESIEGCGRCEFGPTHLIAACRAIVAAKLGDTVQVPADLIGGAA